MTKLGCDSIATGVDINIGVVSIGGMLILNAPPVSAGWPPTLAGPWIPEVIGIGIMPTVGASALPVSYTVMPGRAWIKPLTP